MKKMKIILNDSEIVLPIREGIYEAVCENSESLSDLPHEFTYLLKQMIIPSYEKASLVIGGAILEFEIESYLLDYLSSNKNKFGKFDEEQLLEFNETVRKTLPYGKRPPSQKQLSYVIRISEAIDIDIPSKVFKCVEACSEFIDTYQNEYQEIERYHRALRSEANRVSRWVVANSLHQQGDSLSSIAEKLGVVRESTVEKYVASYSEWRETFLIADEKYQLSLMDFIDEILKSEYSDIYQRNVT